MKLKNAAQHVWVGVGWAKADHLSLCLAQPLPLTPIVHSGLCILSQCAQVHS